MKPPFININHPERWKEDTMQSVDFYNNWYLNFAPHTYRNARNRAIKEVDSTLALTGDLWRMDAGTIRTNPEIFHILRLATAPPLAKARVAGLAGVPQSLVENLEAGKLPPRIASDTLDACLQKITKMFMQLLDYDIFPWLVKRTSPSRIERIRAASIVAERLCTVLSDPIIRGEQERRQLATLSRMLDERGYRLLQAHESVDLRDFPCNSYAYHYNVKVNVGTGTVVNIPVDLVVKPKAASADDLPIMIECKSAGDFTNTNKRRKEEAVKMAQLKNTYGEDVAYVLFLCGYFDCGYLGYEAAEGIDWIWEHRAGELLKLGL